MSKINHKLKGRIRDKVKQVILIEGIPEVLYTIRKHKVAVIKFNNKSYILDIPTDLMNELKKLQTIKVSESTRSSKQFKPLIIPGLGNRTTTKAVNGNTHITIGGADEEQLTERIQIIRDYLTSLGIDNTERCHWTCTVDKAKPDTDYSYPHKLPDTNELTIQTIEKKVSEKKEMSSHTKHLRDIHMKLIEEAKA